MGTLRHDPMAMLPFMGYNAGEYLQNWIDMGKRGGDKLPAIFLVNWFRKDDDGKIIWPGFGDNSRVLKWIVDRIEGRVGADETVVGHTARAEDLDLEGLDTTVEEVKSCLTAPAEKWEADLEDNQEYLTFLGKHVPQEVWDEFDKLKERIDNAK